jgi:hypothetical protein
MYAYWDANDRCPPILMKSARRRIEMDGAPLREKADPPDPSTPRITAVGPNPFRDETWLDLALPRGTPPASIQVFDLSGRIVQTLGVDAANGASSRVVWDGRDASGRRVASGAYFLRLRIEGHAPQVRRVLIMR